MLAGATPRSRAGEGKDAGAEAFEAKGGGEGGDFFIHEGGELLKEKNFERGLLSEGGEVDRGGKRDEFKMAGDGGATDSSERAAENEFECFPLNFRAMKIVVEVVEDSPSHLGGERPSGVTGLGGGFIDRENEPIFAQARRRATG